MKIKDIMSRDLITCTPDDSVLFVSNLMKVWDVGFILITDEDKLYGVVTDRDLVCDMATGLSKIKSYATENVITINENKEVEEAMRLMKKHKIKRLVVTKDQKLSGVLSLSDILQSKANKDLILETIETIYKINRNQNLYEAKVDDFPL